MLRAAAAAPAEAAAAAVRQLVGACLDAPLRSFSSVNRCSPTVHSCCVCHVPPRALAGCRVVQGRAQLRQLVAGCWRGWQSYRIQDCVRKYGLPSLLTHTPLEADCSGRQYMHCPTFSSGPCAVWLPQQWAYMRVAAACTRLLLCRQGCAQPPLPGLPSVAGGSALLGTS